MAENTASPSEIRANTTRPQDSIRLTNLRQAAKEDPEYQQLKHYIIKGFPQQRNQLPEQCRRYWNVRTQLTIDDDLIVFGCRLLVPTTLRHSILLQLHESHQGTVRTKQRARQIVYWPGIDNDIDNIILVCKQCQDTLSSQPREPLITKPRPSRPFQELAIDFCSYGGHQFLIIVDCFTDWPEIIHMGKNTTTSHLITALLDVFCRTGAPDVIWSDQGPQFTSHMFQLFSNEWGFQHITSSPLYPQSNGKAESAVKSMKKIIKGVWIRNQLDKSKLARALLQYRNTPSRRDGLSPAQKLLGKPVQDTIPAHRRAFAPQWQKASTNLDKQDPESSNTVINQHYYDLHAHPLSDIQIGSNVAIQNSTTKRWDIYGIVTHIGPYRQYHVKTSSGRILIRNRRFLRRRIPATPPALQSPAIPPETPAPPPRPPLRHSFRTHQKPLRYVEEYCTPPNT